MKSKKSNNNNNSTKRNRTSKAHRDNATNTREAVKRRPRVGKTQPLEKNQAATNNCQKIKWPQGKI